MDDHQIQGALLEAKFRALQEKIDEMFTHYYIPINQETVPQVVRKTVNALTTTISHRLGIHPPRVVYFQEETRKHREYVKRYSVRDWRFFKHVGPRGLFGKANPRSREIYIHKNLKNPDAIIEVVAHEIRHIWQFEQGMSNRPEDELENDALHFGRQIRREYCN